MSTKALKALKARTARAAAPNARKPRPNSKADLLKAAIDIATTAGLHGFTRLEVTKAAKMSEAAVTWHFGGMEELRRAIVEYALRNRYCAELRAAIPPAIRDAIAAELGL